jgi:hypothetical protein
MQHMRVRTPAHQLASEALEAFRAAAAVIGLDATPAARQQDHDFVVQAPDGSPIFLEIKASSIPNVDRVRTLAAEASPQALSVLVADQIPSAVRAALNHAGLGWLDRRGHLRLVGHGVHIDADLPAQPRELGRVRPDREPIRGRSGLAAAAALLLTPDHPISVSETARIARLNRSSISRAMTSLVDAHLAERRRHGEYRALVPELFWALAEAWPRERTTVRWALSVELGGPHPFADPGDASWVAAGARGALTWGAPLVVTGDYPIELYVPDEQTVRRVAARHRDGSGSEVVLSVDPNGLVTHQGFDAPSFAWAVAHPLFCALDLTATARDREALEQWTPPAQFARVW